ncbi:MAG: RNA-binding protein [Patescibacteria group bacterium]
MGNKLFVGGLPFATTTEELTAHFAQFGTVEDAIVMVDRETGRSRGFGFVTMSTAEEAKAAIDGANGKDLGGREITVNEAKPRN